MALPQLIGLDVGTTSCKAGLFDARGRLLALTSCAYGLERPHPGFAEQDPEQYWSAAVRCIQDLLASPAARPADLAALCSCGQAPTMVLLDGAGAVLRPAILWQDTRAVAEAEQLARDPGPEALAGWLGLRWPVDASLPLARLLWLRRHEPQVLERCALVLLPKDLVQWRLTGRVASDPWSAKGLVHQQTWAPIEALRTLGGARAALAPEIVPSDEVIGRVTAEAAAASGLPAGLPVASGWTDAMAAMLGTGALGEAGLACDVSGTSEVIGLTLPARPAATGPLLTAPVLASGRWQLYGPTQSSGGSLGWAMRTLAAPGLPGAGAEGQLDDALRRAAAAPPGAGGLLFLPYLEGERAPLWDPRARGAFFGLTSSHGPADLLRAVLEGVACSVRHILYAAEEASGTQATEVRVAGGGARLAVWNQVKADVTQRPFRPCAVSENGVLGAAMLGALGAGLFPDARTAGDAMVQLLDPVEPEPAHQALYDAAFARYAALYPRVRDLAT